MKKRLLRASVFALGILVVSGCMPAIAVDFFDDLKIRYGFADWSGNTETNYSRLVTDWVPTFTMFGVTNLISNQEGAIVNGIKNSAYFFHPTNAPSAIIDLRISEQQSVIGAHNMMMETFSNCSAIQPFSLGTTNTVKVGDRCYLGYPTNSYSQIYFVRNNVFVSISTAQSNCPVQIIADDLDNDLKTKSMDN